MNDEINKRNPIMKSGYTYNEMVNFRNSYIKSKDNMTSGYWKGLLTLSAGAIILSFQVFAHFIKATNQYLIFISWVCFSFSLFLALLNYWFAEKSVLRPIKQDKFYIKRVERFHATNVIIFSL